MTNYLAFCCVFYFILALFNPPRSGSAFRMRIRIRATNWMRIHADPDPKHCLEDKNVYFAIGKHFFSVAQIPDHIWKQWDTILKNFGSKYWSLDPFPNTYPNARKNVRIRIRKITFGSTTLLRTIVTLWFKNFPFYIMQYWNCTLLSSTVPNVMAVGWLQSRSNATGSARKFSPYIQ
jgi:hypothetical protein